MPWCPLYCIKQFKHRKFSGCPVAKILPSNAGGTGSIPGRGAKIPYTSWPKNQNIKQKQYCNKFNKDFKNGPHQKNLKKKYSSTNGKSISLSFSSWSSLCWGLKSGDKHLWGIRKKQLAFCTAALGSSDGQIFFLSIEVDVPKQNNGLASYHFVHLNSEMHVRFKNFLVCKLEMIVIVLELEKKCGVLKWLWVIIETISIITISET